MKILLLILGLAGVGNCGDVAEIAIGGEDLGGLYDGLHGGYGGDFENVKSIDGGYDVGAYKVEPLVAPPLLDAGYHASHSPHFHGRGHSHLPHPHAFARVPVGHGYGHVRRPEFYDHIETWRPIIKPNLPVVKKVVAKPFHLPSPIYKHAGHVGRPIYNPQTIVKEVGHGHGDVHLEDHNALLHDHGHVGLGVGLGHAHQLDVNHVAAPVYKPVVPLYKPTPFTVQPSLSYGYSYKLVPTYAYGPAILDEHAGVGYAHGHGYGRQEQGQFL